MKELIETELGNIYYGFGDHMTLSGEAKVAVMKKVKSINIKTISSESAIEVSCIGETIEGEQEKLPKLSYPLDKDVLKTLIEWKQRLSKGE